MGFRTRDRWALPTPTLLQLVLMAGIYLLNFFAGTDPDLWWHLATGRYIVDSGTIPTTDPFSYTALGRSWVTHEWLAELLIYIIYRAGGYLLLVLVFGGLVTLTFGITLRTLRFLGLGPVVAACITCWAAAMSLFGWDVRPQIFSYLFFSLYLFLLIRSRERSDRWLWLIPALMVPWVNLHAGYVMGLVLLALFLLGEGLRSRLTSRGSWPVHYLAVAAATVAATAINPQGPAMLLYPFTYAGTDNASMKFITEWQSPNFHYYFFFLFGASMMALMVAPGKRPVDWALSLPLLALTAMSLQSVRVIPFYAIVVAPVLGMRLAAASKLEPRADGPHFLDEGVEPAAMANIAPTRRRPRATRWNWLVLALCLATMASTLWLSDRPQIGREPRTADYPTAGVQYLRESGIEGNLFNTFHWGGFLIWNFYPERKVFIDGRPDMYGDSFVEEYGKIQEARPDWQEVLEKYQIEVMLVEKESRLATLLAASGEWRELFRGDIESVLVKSP